MQLPTLDIFQIMGSDSSQSSREKTIISLSKYTI